MATQQQERPELLPVIPSDPDSEEVREFAIEQLRRKRRFVEHAVGSAIAVIALVAIWGVTEYNNAGGWPTDGFSESSSTPHVWNIWIIYPVIGLAIFVMVDAWRTFRRKPLTESEIEREIGRLTHG
jgi:protein-S-isoprenylcysteine O-methyltransferase Ste14